MSIIFVLLVKLEYDKTMAMMSKQAAEEGVCNSMILQQQQNADKIQLLKTFDMSIDGTNSSDNHYLQRTEHKF